jgi:hypothetical protein
VSSVEGHAFGISFEAATTSRAMPGWCRARLEFRSGAVGPHDRLEIDADGVLHLTWAHYASYRVASTGERDLRIDVTSEVDRAEALRALAHSVLPLVLPLVGLESLHGAVARIGGAAVILAGDSGAGKSSLAATLAAGGVEVLADDTAAVDGDGRLWPGPPLLCLRPDVVDLLDPSWRIGPYGDKTMFRLPRSPETAAAAPFAVAGFLHLHRRPGATSSLPPTPGTPPRIEPAAGGDAFRLVLRHVRKPEHYREQRGATQFQAVTACARRAGTLSYDPGASCDELVEAVEGWLAPAANGTRHSST